MEWIKLGQMPLVSSQKIRQYRIFRWHQDNVGKEFIVRVKLQF